HPEPAFGKSLPEATGRQRKSVLFTKEQSMKRRVALCLAIPPLVLAAAAVLIAGNPAYVEQLFDRAGYQDGHFTRHWIEALQRSDAVVRCRAVHALGAIGPAAEEAVPALAAVLLGDPKRGPRIEAALALVKFGAAARAAVPALARALSDPEPMVRMNVAL